MEPERARTRSSADRLPPFSPAASAQLLELWLNERAVLDRESVVECLSLVRALAVAASEHYEAVFRVKVLDREWELWERE